MSPHGIDLRMLSGACVLRGGTGQPPRSRFSNRLAVGHRRAPHQKGMSYGDFGATASGHSSLTPLDSRIVNVAARSRIMSNFGRAFRGYLDSVRHQQKPGVATILEKQKKEVCDMRA